MSLVTWFVVALTGLVSTLAAGAIATVILLVLGQAGVLLYRRLQSLGPSPRRG